MDSWEPFAGYCRVGYVDDQGFWFQALLLWVWQVWNEGTCGKCQEQTQETMIYNYYIVWFWLFDRVGL